MAAGPWIKFDKASYYGAIGTIDYDVATADTFKCALLLDTWTPATTADEFADISANEHAGANGYTAGGVGLTSVTYTNTTGTDKWDAADISWTASGGSIVARYAAIYQVATDKLICYCELEIGSDKTATTGNDFVIQLSTSGIFTVA